MRSKFRAKLLAAVGAAADCGGGSVGGLKAISNPGTKKAPLGGAFLDLSNYKLDTKMNKTLIYPAEIDEELPDAFKVHGEKRAFSFDVL